MKIKQWSTPYNPYLEVVLDGGKLLLNTKDANFSYGQLHKVFQKTFNKINLRERLVRDTLILGFGAGSVARILLDELNISTRIVGVEIDNVILEIAKKYFEVHKIKNLYLIEESAFSFVKSCNNSFDLIIVDLFKELEVPREFRQEEFMRSLSKLLLPQGIIIFNFIVNSSSSEKEFKRILENLQNVFKSVTAYKLMGINRVCILQ